MSRSATFSLIACFGICISCSGTSSTNSANGIVRRGTLASVDISRARTSNQKRLFSWEDYGAPAFEKARREKKNILLMGSASWCHWCHVMDETTYHDPRIGNLLTDKFVVIRVDIDERPDIGDRYIDWGWPATILLSSEAEEIGKYRGYIHADDLLPILQAVVAHSAPNKSTVTTDPGLLNPAPEALPWIAAQTLMKMDDWYDTEQGSWGLRQKVPIGENITVELRRAAHGETSALKRAIFTLEKQKVMIDPVWGGVYQYSAAKDWNEPHYEKLMPYQTANLEAYARASAQTGRKDFLEDAQRIAKYLSTLLSSPQGGFYTSQDADVGSHDEKAAFIDGHVYYRLNDAERKKLGMPRIDEHVYAYENGLAIAAFCALYEVTNDAEILNRAVRAADFILQGHVDADGLLRHDAKNPATIRYLADSASFAWALMRLHQVTKDAIWRERAERIARVMESKFLDSSTGAFFAHTEDLSAVGVFAQRQRPFGANVLAARLFAALGADYRNNALRVLTGISSPRAVAGQGRMIGEYILALDEVGQVKW
jgi:uncharacterized protein